MFKQPLSPGRLLRIIEHPDYLCPAGLHSESSSLLLSVQEFLEIAPKSTVLGILKRKEPLEGLLQAKEVQQRTEKWLVDPQRVASCLDSLDATSLELVQSIYLAGKKGLSEANIVNFHSSEAYEAVRSSLLDLQYQLLIYAQGDDSPLFFGFHDLLQPVLSLSLANPSDGNPSGSPEASADLWESYAGKQAPHLAYVLGRIALKEILLTQAGDLHRKSYQLLKSGLSGDRFSSSLTDLEANLILQYLREAGVLVRVRTHFELRSDWNKTLPQTGNVIRKNLIHFVLDRILGTRSQALSTLATQGAIPLSGLLPLFQLGEGDKKRASASRTWEQLPQAIQLLFLIGVIELGMRRGRIHAVRFLDPHQAFDTPGEERPMGLPNLEAYVPPSLALPTRVITEMIGNKTNDEAITRYTFSRDSLLRGLQAGAPPEQVKAAIQKLGFSGETLHSFDTWIRSFTETSFSQPLLLRVRDPLKCQEFAQMETFMQWIQEVIPDYGFLVRPQARGEVENFLNQFGLVPRDQTTEKTKPKELEAISMLRMLPKRAGTQPIQFQIQEPLPRHLQTRSSSLQAETKQEPAPYERTKLIEYAILTKKSIRLALRTKPRTSVLVRAHSLLKEKTPIKLIATEVESGHRGEYSIDSIDEIKVID